MFKTLVQFIFALTNLQNTQISIFKISDFSGFFRCQGRHFLSNFTKIYGVVAIKVVQVYQYSTNNSFVCFLIPQEQNLHHSCFYVLFLRFYTWILSKIMIFGVIFKLKMLKMLKIVFLILWSIYLRYEVITTAQRSFQLVLQLDGFGFLRFALEISKKSIFSNFDFQNFHNFRENFTWKIWKF